MSDLADRFAAAAEASKQLPEKPANEDLLKLYALYKRGTVGDATGDRPGMMDFVGRAVDEARSHLTTAPEDASEILRVAL